MLLARWVVAWHLRSLLVGFSSQHILTFYTYFDLPRTKQIVFVTEIMTSGTLKQYIHKAKRIKRKVRAFPPVGTFLYFGVFPTLRTSPPL